MARNEVLDRIFRPQQKRRRFALPFRLVDPHGRAGRGRARHLLLDDALGAQPLFPGNPLDESKPTTTALTPLQPVTRTSVVIAPVAVAALAIRDAMETQAPRGLTGKNENPLAELLGKADIGWTIGRGPIAVSGASTGLNITTTLNGSLRVTGQLANTGGNLTGAVGGLLGSKFGGEVQKLTTKRARPARRHPRQRRGHGQARAAVELADRAQPVRPRRHSPTAA